MKKEIICTVCPRGCAITVEGGDGKVTSIEGNGCKRGLSFAETEFTAPVRLLTSTVRVAGKENELLPVRTRTPILRDKLFDVMDAIRATTVTLPVKQHDVILADVCGTGVDVIASRDMQ